MFVVVPFLVFTFNNTVYNNNNVSNMIIINNGIQFFGCEVTWLQVSSIIRVSRKKSNNNSPNFHLNYAACNVIKKTEQRQRQKRTKTREIPKLNWNWKY